MARKKKVATSEVASTEEITFTGVDLAAGPDETAVVTARVSSREKHGPFTIERVASLKPTPLLVVPEDSPAWIPTVDLGVVATLVQGAIVWVDLPRAEGSDVAHVERVLAAVRSTALSVKTTPARRSAQPMKREAARQAHATHRQVVEELAAASASPRRELVVEGVRRTMDEEKI